MTEFKADGWTWRVGRRPNYLCLRCRRSRKAASWGSRVTCACGHQMTCVGDRPRIPRRDASSREWRAFARRFRLRICGIGLSSKPRRVTPRKIPPYCGFENMGERKRRLRRADERRKRRRP